MKSSCCTEDEDQPSAVLDCEALFRLEIEFWQEILATCPGSQSAASVERMQQALALAEIKLARVSMPSIPTSYQSRRIQ